MDLWIAHDGLPVGCHQVCRDRVGARFIECLHGYFREAEPGADARSHEAAVELQGVKHAAAHGAAANHAEIYLLHNGRKACREPPWQTIQFSIEH